VQKYEKGTNRISASRLQQISQILQVPIPFFFEGADANPEVAFPAYVSDFLATSEGLATRRIPGIWCSSRIGVLLIS
jgi:transcriptional regulator with XRE-family HTH domain